MGETILFRFLHKKPKAGAVVGVHFADDGLAVARCRTDGSERLDLALFKPTAGPADRARVLAEVVKERGLAGYPCVCTLGPGQYQLIQVEAPDVDPTELRAAIRWRIKDLIDYHIDDAVVDAFAVPDPHGRSGPRMMFAAAARLRFVQELVEIIEASGLRLQAVDVAELSLRNLGSHVPEQAGGIAMLALGERRGLVTMCQGESLYLARSLDFGTQELLNEGQLRYESLVLELQRSLDYYESQLAGVPASRILVPAMNGPREAVVEYLNQQLATAAYAMDLEQILETAEPVPDEVQVCALYAVGAALRREHATL